MIKKLTVNITIDAAKVISALGFLVLCVAKARGYI